MPLIRAACDPPVVVRNLLPKSPGPSICDGLAAALQMPREAVVAEVEASGERGRGGAAYPTGSKWRACFEADGGEKYVIANGDEGDPGSFIDRVLMEFDPQSILEGMAICGHAIGASNGIVYIRSEYPRAVGRMRDAVDEAQRSGRLGSSILGSDFSFDVSIEVGLGSYVCGEETSMLNAIEGRRGEVRLRPPYPTRSGLHGKPTIVNNVETLLNIPWILANGAEAYRAFGTEACSGTKAMCLNWGFKSPGIVEVEFGTMLRDVIEQHGGGSCEGESIEAVLLGGPMGSVVFADEWDLPICYDAMREKGVALGHGGMVALHAGIDWQRLLVHLLQFMAHESCGKCVPCRLGSQEALRLAREGARDRRRLRELLDVMREGSLCAFGREMPRSLETILSKIEGERA